MSDERVMLLIDADNISVDVMEQAVKLLLNQHGALHVRRAYCTAESAVKHQAIFKHLGIKPMVNLAAGKNSTDIALAVDAVDLVLAERPDVVVIASSDSDFAPLVHRLREKGCVVRGIGQQGKVGDETQGVYDDYTVLEHRKGDADEAPAKPARKSARSSARSTARKTAAKASTKAPAKVEAPAAAAVVAPVTGDEAAAEAPAAKAPAAKKAAAKKVAAKKAPAAKKVVAKKAPARKKASPAAEPDQPVTPVPEPAAPAPASTPVAAEPASALAAVLACLPELAAGQPMALNVAVQRLREAKLLGKNSSSLRFFAQFGSRFELGPPDKPTRVRYAG